MGGHEIVETAQCGLPLVGAPLNPVDTEADRSPADHSEVQRRDGVTHTTMIFAGRHIQPQMQAVFYAPIVTIRRKHLLRSHTVRRHRSEQPLSFDFFLCLLASVNEPCQSCRLFDIWEAALFRLSIQAHQTASFHPAPVEFHALNRIRSLLRGKRPAATLCRVAARCWQPSVGCLLR